MYNFLKVRKDNKFPNRRTHHEKNFLVIFAGGFKRNGN